MEDILKHRLAERRRELERAQLQHDQAADVWNAARTAYYKADAVLAEEAAGLAAAQARVEELESLAGSKP